MVPHMRDTFSQCSSCASRWFSSQDELPDVARPLPLLFKCPAAWVWHDVRKSGNQIKACADINYARGRFKWQILQHAKIGHERGLPIWAFRFKRSGTTCPVPPIPATHVNVNIDIFHILAFADTCLESPSPTIRSIPVSGRYHFDGNAAECQMILIAPFRKQWYEITQRT